MGDGWGGVRDKSQRGLGPWEPLLLWSVKSTGSKWSTWPLQRAYSSKSACEGDDKTPSADLQGLVCCSSGRFCPFGPLSVLKSIQSAWVYEIKESRCSIDGENFSKTLMDDCHVITGWVQNPSPDTIWLIISCVYHILAFSCVSKENFLKTIVALSQIIKKETSKRVVKALKSYLHILFSGEWARRESNVN